MSVRRALPWLIGAAILAGALCAQGQEPTDNLFVAKCKADLAARLEVSADELTVVSVEEVTWPDASLGCPEPGMDYTMALVDGYRIVLEVQGKAYEYHTDRARRFVYCEQPAGATQDREGPGPRPPAQDTPIGPEPARPVVLALEAIPDEPNGNSKLVAWHLPSEGDEPETVLDRCVDFVAAEAGPILAKRRTSRSSHELLLTRQGQEPLTLMKAFDFEALTFVPPGADYFFLARDSAGAPFRTYGGDLRGPPVALEWAPEVEWGHGATVHSLQGVLLVSAPAAADGPEREIIVLDLNAAKVVARFRAAGAVLGLWVPDR